MKTRIFAYCSAPVEKVSVLVPIIIPRIVITSEITGYTIQALKGAEAYTYDPAVIVPAYKTNVVLSKNDGSEEYKFSFDVTRDAWYSLGKDENQKHVLLNRAFVPRNPKRNLYDAMWIPNYPSRSGLDAFIFRRFGKRAIPAKPLQTQTRLDGKPITSPRKNPNLATDVMIHVGGTYEVFTIEHLGGSYGCFAFIQKEDIYATPKEAKQACLDDDYDDNTTNSDWLKVADKIINLLGKNKKAQILLENRDESKNYFPTEVLKE